MSSKAVEHDGQQFEARSMETNMSTKMVETKSMTSPDEVGTLDKGKLELVKVGAGTIGPATFDSGWK
jgi:hypothetical protein